MSLGPVEGHRRREFRDLCLGKHLYGHQIRNRVMGTMFSTNGRFKIFGSYRRKNSLKLLTEGTIGRQMIILKWNWCRIGSIVWLL